MKHVSGKRMCRVLQGKAWACVRIKGSHHAYASATRPGVIVTVPVHGNRTLKPGTQRSIMRSAGLTDTDL